MNIYFDYLCPFAWRGVELLAALEQPANLRHFSLVQGNHTENAGLPRHAPVWKLAEQPLEAGGNTSASLDAFFGSHAAKLQGDAAHLRFALALFRAKHQDKKDLNAKTVLEAAQTAKLDVAAFEAALADEPARRTELAADLEMAGELAVFGTPTIQLESGAAAYFRFGKLPETKSEQQALWQVYQNVLESGADIQTIKRPRR
jgi:predicted DsbA family dithiol-disulfide isomerase